MARTLSPISGCELLQSHPRLTGKLGRYSYLIETQGAKSLYTVTDGRQTTTQALVWAVGLGRGGQSYLYVRNSVYYEARVSYFRSIDNLDLTLGHPQAEPAGLDEAAGRPLTDADVMKCFNCHSTGQQSVSHLAERTPGIACEKCHGPGGKHVAAVQSGKMNGLGIFNPGRMKVEDQVYTFCGSCHRNAFDVADNKASGIATIRFEPYRLILSRCFDSRDARIACTACHDAHDRMHEDPAFYDAKCLDCHAGPRRPASAGKITGAPCPAATRNCVTCHMPKLELPGDHFKFADHDIRVVKPGEPFPG